MLAINRLLDIQVADDPPAILFSYPDAHLIAPTVDTLIGFWLCSSLFLSVKAIRQTHADAA